MNEIESKISFVETTKFGIDVISNAWSAYGTYNGKRAKKLISELKKKDKEYPLAENYLLETAHFFDSLYEKGLDESPVSFAVRAPHLEAIKRFSAMCHKLQFVDTLEMFLIEYGYMGVDWVTPTSLCKDLEPNQEIRVQGVEWDGTLYEDLAIINLGTKDLPSYHIKVKNESDLNDAVLRKLIKDNGYLNVEDASKDFSFSPLDFIVLRKDEPCDDKYITGLENKIFTDFDYHPDIDTQVYSDLLEEYNDVKNHDNREIIQSALQSVLTFGISSKETFDKAVGAYKVLKEREESTQADFEAWKKSQLKANEHSNISYGVNLRQFVNTSEMGYLKVKALIIDSYDENEVYFTSGDIYVITTNSFVTQDNITYRQSTSPLKIVLCGDGDIPIKKIEPENVIFFDLATANLFLVKPKLDSHTPDNIYGSIEANQEYLNRYNEISAIVNA